jgi:hypothetical protein
LHGLHRRNIEIAEQVVEEYPASSKKIAMAAYATGDWK